MQTVASKRLLSTLASKLHPQVPLSPRESQQLLNLLTTSFRAHLDREYPGAAQSLSETNNGRHLQQPRQTSAKRRLSAPRGPSSHASATQHIDSILFNPLFAVKPRRRGSDSAATSVLQDPLNWFLNEVAIGAATLPKAAICLEVLGQTANISPSTARNSRTTASIMAQWLQTSGLDTCKEFLNLCLTKDRHGSGFLHRLVKLLVKEDETQALWRWFIRPEEQRMKETKYDSYTVTMFRGQLLRAMVATEASSSLEKGIATFMQAFRFSEIRPTEVSHSVLKYAAAHLVHRLAPAPDTSISPELYTSFLRTTPVWLAGQWGQAVESMLWLHHPTAPSALPGLRFLENSNGAITFVKASRSRRNFLVQLCLGVARELIRNEKYAEARVAMQFTKDHFDDMVMPDAPVVSQEKTKQRIEKKERRNIELLEGLALG